MCCISRSLKERFKLQEAYDAGLVLGLNRKINGPCIKNNLVKILPGLYGQPTETSVILERIETGALLDTGSTVSTISELYYQQHLACSLPLKTINEILDIECAGGSQLPYSGYIEVNINTPGSTNNFNTYLVLVVPDSNYKHHIPLLIGTNVLNTMHQLHGDKYLQNAALTTPWYLTLRYIALHEKELKKNKKKTDLS
jgi:hypothetical protein